MACNRIVWTIDDDQSSEGGADLGLDENTSVSVPAPPSVEQEAKDAKR